MSEVISFNKFKQATHHKRVKYTWDMAEGHWNYKKGKHFKEFMTDKFYCNTHGDNLSTPKFGMAKKQEWLQLADNKYQATSEHGITTFEVLE